MTSQTIQCAILVKPVRKEEWINTFLIEITLNPKITNEQLAEKFNCHRNTVSKYRKVIRERQQRTNVEIVNKIDNVLEDRLPNMENRDLIGYRRAVSPQEVKVDQNIKQIELIYHVTKTDKQIRASRGTA